MNFINALNSISTGNVKPVYLVQGKQQYLINQLKNKFIDLVAPEERTMNYANYDIEDNPLGDAIGDAMSAPFFGERRVVIINNPFFLTGEKTSGKQKVDKSEIEMFVNYLNHPMPTTTLVIIAPYNKLDGRKKVTKVLKRSSELIDFTNLYENQVRQYVHNYLQNRHFRINNDAVDILITKTGNQLSLIMNEIPKLMLYCNQAKVIDSDAVNQLVDNSLTQNAFDLVDLVLNFKSIDAIDLYHNLLSSVQSSKLTSMALKINALLISQFRLLIQIMVLEKQGYSQGSLASELKTHPYRIKLAMRKVNSFDIKKLQSAYLSLFNLENQLKSGNSSPELLFEIFVIKFVSKN